MGASPERDDKEVFTVYPVSAAELRDIDFCTDLAEALFNMADSLAFGVLGYSERKHQTQVLFFGFFVVLRPNVRCADRKLLCELAAFIISAPRAVDDPTLQKGVT
jgi:hypothetical protein